MTDISPTPPRTYGFVDRSSGFTQAAEGYPPARTGLSQTLSNVDSARQMRLVIDNYPELGDDPGALVGIIQGGGTDEQMFLRASQAVSMADMANFADNLKGSDPVTQRTRWANLDKPRQAALTQMGYAPPPVHPDDEGGWTIGIAGHDLFDVGGAGVVGAVTSPLSFSMDAVAGFLGRTIDYSTNLYDFAPHVVRTVAAQKEAGTGPTDYGSLFNMGEWANSWSRTSDGAHFFHEDHEEAARGYLEDHPWDEERLGPKPDPELRFTVARSLAAGDGAGDYARSLGLDEDHNPTEWHDAVLKWNQIVADPEVRRAGEDLENGHMTFGRSMLRNLGVNDYHSPYAMAASGAFDAWLAFKLDPVILLSKAHTASNVMRYGLRLEEAAGDLDKTVRYARAWDAGRETAVKAMYRAEGGVMDSSYRQTLARARHVSAKAEQLSVLNDPHSAAAQRLLRDSPEALLTFPSITGWKAIQEGEANLTPDRVYDFWQSSFGTRSIVKTTGLRSHQVQLLPHLTPTQQALLQTKGFMTDAVNVMAEAGTTARNARELLPESARLAAEKFSPENIDSMSQLFLDKAVAPVGRFFQAFTTHGAYRQGLLDLGNPDMATEIQRFVNLGQIVGMTEAERFAWNAKMLGDFNPITGKITINKAMMQGTALEFLDRVMEMGGIQGEAFAKRFVGRAEQMYGLSPDSYVRVGDTTTRSGVFSIDTANGMAIPSPMELIQATRTQSATKAIFGSITASPLEATMTRVWKPLTLMHMGFIPRIAGEELLGFTLRKGPINAGRNVLARWASDWEPAVEAAGGMVRRKSPEFMATLPIKWMTGHLVDLTRVEGQAPSQLNVIAGALDGYVQRLALYGHDAVHGLAERVGMPNRRDLLKQLVGKRVLDDYYESMNSSVFRRSQAEHASAAYWGHPDNEVAFHSMPLDVWRGNKRLRMWLPMRDDVAAQKAYEQAGTIGAKVREQNVYADIYMNALMRKTAAPDALVGLRNMHLTTDGQVTRVDRALTDMGYATHVPGPGAAAVPEEQVRRATETARGFEVGAMADTVTGAGSHAVIASYHEAGLPSFGWLDHETGQLTPQYWENRNQVHEALDGGREYWGDVVDATGVSEEAQAIKTVQNAFLTLERAQGPAAVTNDPLERLKAFKTVLDEHLGPQGREVLYRHIDGETTAQEAAEILAEGAEKATTVEQRFALSNLAKALENPSLRYEDVGLLANDRLHTPLLTTDRAKVTEQMAKAHEDFLYDPANSDIVADLILANYHNGTPVVAPIANGHRPLYVPMVDPQSVQKLRAMAIDPAERERFRAALVQTFEQRGLDAAAIDHILDAVLPTDENLRRAHGTLLAGQALKRNDRLVPGGLWGSNDDRVADAVTDTINLVATGNKQATLGVAAVPDQYWHNATYPDAGLHAGPGRSYGADNFLLTNPQALTPSQRLTLSEVKLRDGITRWVDDGQLRRMSARKELAVGDDGRPVVVQTQQQAGTSASQAVTNLSRLQATDLLDRLAPTDQGVLHSLLEPMTRGEKFVTDPQGVVSRMPSHLTPDHYINADGNLMPTRVYGPEKVLGQHTRWENWTNKWFEGAVQPALSAFSRNPMMVEAYGDSARLARGLFGDAWIPENIRGDWSALKTKIGLSPKDEQTVFREWERLPQTLTDPDASVANFAKVLGNLLGTKLHTPEEALRLAELEKGAAEATKVGVPPLRRLMTEGEGMTEQAAQAVREAALKANEAANAERLALAAKLEGSAEFLPQEMRTFRSYTRARLNVERHVTEIASQAAMQKVVPYIHDPSVRSHFQSYVGTLMPFQFAEEQFLKRWAKTFIDDPGAARKLMILHDGLRNTGIVQKDPFTGEDVFIWPGSDVLNRVMAQANPIWPGAGTFRGLAYAPMSGTTSMIIPGFGEPVAPNLGPVAGLALHGITHLFPEFAPLEDTMASDRANPDRGVLEWVVPHHLSRILEAFRGDVDQGQLASLAKNSIAYLTANGQGPPVDGTAHERTAWLDKVRDLARTQLLLRGVFGLLGPSGGTTIDYHDALADDYRSMLADGLSPEEAFGIFVAKHHGEVSPETVFPAYTVFATRTAAGAKLPQTQEAVDFIEGNASLVQNFPLAMSWLLPQAEAGAPRVRQAYTQQLRAGLRKTRTPAEFLDQILFAEGADTYFNWYDEHKARVAALPVGSQALADENDTWKIRALTWKAQNPVFAKMLEDPTASQRRQGVRDELTQLLVGPVADVDPGQQADLKVMMDGWSSLQQSLDALKFSRRTAAVQKMERELPQRFIAWAHSWLAVHPRMLSFYNSVLRPDLPDEVIARG